MMLRSSSPSRRQNSRTIYPRHIIRQGTSTSRRRAFPIHIRRLLISPDTTRRMLVSYMSDCRSGASPTTPLKRLGGLLCSNTCAAPRGDMSDSWSGSDSSAITSTSHTPTPLTSDDQAIGGFPLLQVRLHLPLLRGSVLTL
ncbi:hypothetical protein LINPERPRIM_LOCUS38392 [Linum perenne]